MQNAKCKMQKCKNAKMQSPVFISYSFYILFKQNYYSQVITEQNRDRFKLN